MNHKVLITSADFDNAIFFQKKVEVWQCDEIIDYGGIIQEHSNNAARINDAWFLKANCEFRVRS